MVVTFTNVKKPDSVGISSIRYFLILALLLYAGTHNIVHGYHRCLGKRFPFAVYYLVEGEMIRIICSIGLPPQPGVDANELCRRIEAQTGLRARTSNQFRWDCVLYYLKNTGIPVNFGITIAIALIVGVVVAGQTFYLFTVENLKQFGAIKAIGVTNGRLIGMILLQAFTVGVIGFSIGTGMAGEFFDFFASKLATRGIILMWQSVALTGGCIFFVMILASILSLRRVLVLEPAIVFRG